MKFHWIFFCDNFKKKLYNTFSFYKVTLFYFKFIIIIIIGCGSNPPVFYTQQLEAVVLFLGFYHIIKVFNSLL